MLPVASPAAAFTLDEMMDHQFENVFYFILCRADESGFKVDYTA